MMNENASTGRVLWVTCCLALSAAFSFSIGTHEAQAAPAITSPTPGSTLSGSSTEIFTWTAGGSNIAEWWLYVGKSKGAKDLYDSKSLGSAISDTINDLPTDGSTLHVRLWHRIAEDWSVTDSTYTAFNTGGSGGGLSAMPPWDQALPAEERFVLVLGGAAVLDKETGLVWQQSPSTTLSDWDDAINRCVQTGTGGRQGWRLPSVHELGSLVDRSSRPVTLPVGHPFSNIQADEYWTATTASVNNPDAAWILRFNGGPHNDRTKSANAFTWCVRGGGTLSVY